MRKFFHAPKVFSNFSLKNNLTRKLRLKELAIELILSPHVLDS